MNFQEIEKLRIDLLTILPNLFGKTKLSKISSFYSSLLSTKDNKLIEAYSLDFFTEYLCELKLYNPFYQAPDTSENLLAQLKKLRSVYTLAQFENEFDLIIVSIKNQLDQLNNALLGKTKNTSKKALRFPLVESSNYNTTTFCTLESVNINIRKAKNSNRFVFVPTGSKVEELLLQQAQICLEIALDYLSKHKNKFHVHHEVLIYFENLTANYEGNSLGVALTIGLIEQLSLLYNLPYVTNVINILATTGGVNNLGKVIPVGKENIESKIEAVFYSEIDTFIIPKEDETYAAAVFENLLEKYPNRELNIVTISDIKDFLNRRDLVDIKKQPRIIRYARAIKKNWLASTLFLLLTLILIFLYIRDFDDNPAYIEGEGQTMFVKNKIGETLWTKNISYFTRLSIHKTIPQYFHILVDVNNDGENEIIVSQETFPDSLSHLRGRIICFDKYGNQKWQYIFKDTMRTKNETITPVYNTRLIGIIKEETRKVLLAIAVNGPNFPSAVFKINVENGERVSGTLWNAGHIMMGLIRTRENGKHEIVCNMFNNDYEKVGIFGIDYENLNGITPYKKDNYKLLGLNNAKLNFYIFVPRTDYNVLTKQRQNCLELPMFDEKRFDAINFSTTEEKLGEDTSIGYEYNNKTKEINVVIISTFRVRRDSLVAHGKLKPPYTDTPEYKALLKSQVLFWNGKEFVKRNELK